VEPSALAVMTIGDVLLEFANTEAVVDDEE
jgi:hypothetical protein